VRLHPPPYSIGESAYQSILLPELFPLLLLHRAVRSRDDDRLGGGLSAKEGNHILHVLTENASSAGLSELPKLVKAACNCIDFRVSQLA
jgi:hypothetical protein